jgi:hypothetical protein
MVKIHYESRAQYRWANEFFRRCSTLGISWQPYLETLELETNHSQIERLFQCISDPQKVAIMPSLPEKTKPDHRWLVVGPDPQILEQAINRLQHFLVPTYAIFVDDSVPIFHYFTEHENQFFKLAAHIYPHSGYYILRSRPGDVDIILQRLSMWLQLEEHRPEIQQEDQFPTYTYLALYERLQLALATAQWDEANIIRDRIRSHHLTTADNLRFLEIEQLATQQCWKDIRSHQDFQQLTRTRIPRNVRGALLTAFYQTSRLPQLESQRQWKTALEEFREKLPELGLLLTGRLGLTQGPVIHMFAYQAAIEKDRRALLDLIDVNNDPASLECIKQLLELLEEESPNIAETSLDAVMIADRIGITPFYRVIEALNNGNADMAQKLALDIEDEQLRISLLMQIAFLSNDLTQATEVWQTFCGLSQIDQDALRKRFPLFQAIENMLSSWAIQAIAEKSPQTSLPETKIVDWMDWFDYLSHAPNDPILISLLENFINDERFWSIEHVQRLNDYLLMLEEDTKRLPCVRDAIQKLLAYFLNKETGFPREEAVYQDLYEVLYTVLVVKTAQEEMKNNGPILFLLANTILSSAPQKVEFVFHELQEWCGKPILKLEAWALEAIEMLIDYGIEPGLLAGWYREWVEQLINRQTHYQLTHLEGWLELGHVIQPGGNLLDMLQQKAATVVAEQAGIDAIKKLPEGYRIVIYTLQERAAQRAQTLLFRRNPSLDIRICADTVLTDSAKTLAENSDAVVMVTTAMKHALSYGLDGHIKKEKRIFPQDSGSTGIIRAIEEFARRESNL